MVKTRETFGHSQKEDYFLLKGQLLFFQKPTYIVFTAAQG